MKKNQTKEDTVLGTYKYNLLLGIFTILVIEKLCSQGITWPWCYLCV